MNLVKFFEPAVGRSSRDEGFAQTIRVHAAGAEAGKPIGTARWALTAAPDDGAVQLIELTVSPPFARRGYGKQLLDEAIEQARTYLRLRKTRLRRVWMAVSQKDQVIGRSFLTGQGFHHISTVDNLLKGQDLLIYVRTFD